AFAPSAAATTLKSGCASSRAASSSRTTRLSSITNTRILFATPPTSYPSDRCTWGRATAPLASTSGAGGATEWPWAYPTVLLVTDYGEHGSERHWDNTLGRRRRT